MSKCQSKYGASTSKDDCSPTPSVNHLLRASAIVATGVFLAITVVLLICILHKRRMIFFGRLRTGPGGRVQHPPALYIWSAPSATPAAPTDPPAASPPAPAPAAARMKSAKGGALTGDPISCVIMAGEVHPTHLARPLPSDEFVDVSADPKLDDLERGKRKTTLNSSRGSPRHY